MAHKPYEDVEIEGHLIDSLMMPQIMDNIMDLDGEFEMLSFVVGRKKTDPSHAVMRIFGRDAAHLDALLTAITEHGVVAVKPQDAALEAADLDGVFPQEFYSTTNLETFVRVGGEWVRVLHPEMDCGIRVHVEAGTAETVAMGDVKAGELYVTGHKGIRVLPLERTRESQPFEFMASAVSSEKPKAQIVREVAKLLRHVKEEGKLTIAVVGPAVVHTGAAPSLARLIEAGYVGAVFGGNAVATHDIEANLFGTSLGIDLKEGTPVPGGHEHHLRAINTIRRCGSIAAAVEQGVLDRRPHAHSRQDRDAVRARRQHPRRRPAARGDHRRDAGAEDDARVRAARRRLPDAEHHAAQHRRRQHAAGCRPHRLRRHQPRGRDQARRPRQLPGHRHRHRRRPVHRAARERAHRRRLLTPEGALPIPDDPSYDPGNSPTYSTRLPSETAPPDMVDDPTLVWAQRCAGLGALFAGLTGVFLTLAVVGFSREDRWGRATVRGLPVNAWPFLGGALMLGVTLAVAVAIFVFAYRLTESPRAGRGVFVGAAVLFVAACAGPGVRP